MGILLQDEGNDRRQSDKVYTCTHCQKNFSTKGHLKVKSFILDNVFEFQF